VRDEILGIRSLAHAYGDCRGRLETVGRMLVSQSRVAYSVVLVLPHGTRLVDLGDFRLYHDDLDRFERYRNQESLK
jgi:hypothetical protein